MVRIVGGRGGKRLKGLDEFETPTFVGRMARVEKGRRAAFNVILVIAVAVGGAIGWLLG